MAARGAKYAVSYCILFSEVLCCISEDRSGSLNTRSKFAFASPIVVRSSVSMMSQRRPWACAEWGAGMRSACSWDKTCQRLRPVQPTHGGNVRLCVCLPVCLSTSASACPGVATWCEWVKYDGYSDRSRRRHRLCTFIVHHVRATETVRTDNERMRVHHSSLIKLIHFIYVNVVKSAPSGIVLPSQSHPTEISWSSSG